MYHHDYLWLVACNLFDQRKERKERAKMGV